MVIIALIVVLATGNVAVVLLPVIGCMLMMGVMMYMMINMGGRGGGGS
jgi:hypothetical protein